MSADTAAVKRLITNLKTMSTKASKAAALIKAERVARQQELLGVYQTEDEIQDAFGYAEITEEERDALLAALEGRDNPSHQDLGEEEIYVLELSDLIGREQRRLRDLEWDELPESEKERIMAEKEAYMSRRSLRKGGKEADHGEVYF